MKKITATELKEILRLHRLWLHGAPTGSRADLQYASLKGASLEYADLRHSRLEGADLQGVNLQHADLEYADLQGVNLQYARLEYANLGYADLRHSRLGGADLKGVLLPRCRGNDREIKGTYFDPYCIVYTKDVLFIGCEGHSREEWEEFSDTVIDDMELGRSLDFWIENKERCLALQGRDELSCN